MQPLDSNPLGFSWELEATEVHTHERSVFLNTCVHGFEIRKFNVVWHFGFKHPRLVYPLVFLVVDAHLSSLLRGTSWDYCRWGVHSPWTYPWFRFSWYCPLVALWFSTRCPYSDCHFCGLDFVYSLTLLTCWPASFWRCSWLCHLALCTGLWNWRLNQTVQTMC